MGRVDDGIALAREDGVIFTCFGDMMRVPGSDGTFTRREGRAAPTSAWSTRRSTRCGSRSRTPTATVVFFAIGFETTAPSTALTLKRAKAEGVENFLCMCNHVTIVPPLRALLDSPDLRLDGFIGPGHVSTVVGVAAVRVHPRRLRQAAGHRRASSRSTSSRRSR